MSASLRSRWALGTLLLLASCGGGQPSILLQLELDPSLGVTQLSVTAATADGQSMGPVLRPELEAGPIAPVERVRLTFPEALQGGAVEVTVEGLRAGVAVARTAGSVTLASGQETKLSLRLGAPAQGECSGGCGPGLECVDGGCRCTPASCRIGQCRDNVCSAPAEAAACGDSGRPCEPGQRCIGGLCTCDSSSCPSGCCDGNECELRSLRACGIAGSTCVACAVSLADNCSADGKCRCGAGDPCGTGQRCSSGQCLCDAASCVAGCCLGAECRAPSLGACGVGGSACAACQAQKADACAATGECRCGPGPACGAGQRCKGGACVCDSSSCDGCCQDDLCLTGDSPAACGLDGRACRECAPGSSCAAGTCQLCANCTTGCCDGSVCRMPSLAACGVGGDACVACDPMRADGCSPLGKCQCGGGPPCAAGQQCVGGACVCNASSCAGCCSQDVCVSGDMKNACGVGGVLCARCTGASVCSDGECR